MLSNFVYSLKEPNKKSYLNSTKDVFSNPKFLYDNLNNEIKIYKDEHQNISCYNFFQKISFELNKIVISSTCKDFKEINNSLNNCEYMCFYISQKEIDLNDENISLLLRGSNTLIINEKNSYDNIDIKVVFSEKGFVFINKFTKDQIDKFQNILTLYLLSHAYNLYTEQIMSEITTLHKENKIEKMLKIKKEVYGFNLSCFFSYPVKYNRHQLNQLWSYLNDMYFIKDKHLEMKYQIEDLINLVEMNKKEQEKLDKEVQERLEEKRYKEVQEQRELDNIHFNKKAEKLTKIALFIAVISLLSLVGAYKDFKDLDGITYINEFFQDSSKIKEIK
ncbi:MAG: hypothetical protein KA055_00085 [Aliarcobacter sp.]|nr:hypothetical protein [Aliarcobacter sp.]